jgi:hypothetical protein
VDDPATAVCLLPGTELAFDAEVQCETGRLIPWRWLGQKVARFRHINEDRPNAHHDALEFADGRIMLLTQLRKGQHATVLQLPVTTEVKANEELEASLVP